MTEPRPLTEEEMREKLFAVMAGSVRWWANETPERLKPLMKDGQTEAQARLEGLLFSLLNVLDGGNMDVPGMVMIPVLHEDDEAFHREQGENWWTGQAINDDVALHEIFPWEKCR